jgi:three-Cys-motif partner protein
MSGATRAWGFWTQLKLQILIDYLEGFAAASRAQRERVYFDPFAGEGAGVDRQTGEEFPGSARIALETGGGSGFTRFRFFELDSTRARDLEQRLQALYPGRDIRVYAGDCNAMIPVALDALRSLNWAPTFAFLDPDGIELAWQTVVTLADHKRGYRSTASSKPEYKVELWMLFPSAGLVRTLALDGTKLSAADEAKATRLFGSEAWRPIYEARRRGEINAAEAREEYVNLMRWRLENELGYRFTHAFEVKNTNGVPLYHMIFATDNDAGTKIMSAVYDKAALSQPQMRQEARDRATGQQTLNLDIPIAQPEATYRYEPPWEPRR